MTLIETVPQINRFSHLLAVIALVLLSGCVSNNAGQTANEKSTDNAFNHPSIADTKAENDLIGNWASLALKTTAFSNVSQIHFTFLQNNILQVEAKRDDDKTNSPQTLQ